MIYVLHVSWVCKQKGIWIKLAGHETFLRSGCFMCPEVVQQWQHLQAGPPSSWEEQCAVTGGWTSPRFLLRRGTLCQSSKELGTNQQRNWESGIKKTCKASLKNDLPSRNETFVGKSIWGFFDLIGQGLHMSAQRFFVALDVLKGKSSLDNVEALFGRRAQNWSWWLLVVPEKWGKVWQDSD